MKENFSYLKFIYFIHTHMHIPHIHAQTHKSVIIELEKIAELKPRGSTIPKNSKSRVLTVALQRHLTSFQSTNIYLNTKLPKKPNENK